MVSNFHAINFGSIIIVQPNFGWFSYWKCLVKFLEMHEPDKLRTYMDINNSFDMLTYN